MAYLVVTKFPICPQPALRADRPARLDRHADIALSEGRHGVAERLSTLAAEMRERFSLEVSGNRQNGRPPMVLTRLWAKTSGKGNRNLTGWLGAAKILIMENKDRQNEDDATHVLMLAEPSDKQNGEDQQ